MDPSNARALPLPAWTATGVGSLPGTEAREAAARILRAFPELPYWPQLPALGPEEEMLWQFLPRLPQVPPQQAWDGKTGLEAGELRAWLQGELTGRAVPMDSAPGLEALEALLGSGAGREERCVKGQLTGPVTLALALQDRAGRPLAGRPELIELLVERLLEAGLRQARRLRRVAGHMLLVIDEPALFRLDRPAASAPDGPQASVLESSLCALVTALKAEGLIVGIHTCGPPCWERLSALGADVLSVDVYRYAPAEEDLRWIRRFLEAGGRVAWGLVPAVRGCPPAQELAAAAAGFLERLGPELLSGSLLTACCGLATLDGAAALEVEQRVCETRERLRQA
jgi:hypothetical protein